MKTSFARRTSVLAVAALAMALGSAVASADDISNDLDPSIDASAEVMDLTAGGTPGTTTLFVQPRNGDGKNGCNLTGSTILTFSVASSDTAVATVSPSSVTFTSCGDTHVVTVTPVAAGSATVSLSETANTSSGTFDLAPATLRVNVAAATTVDTTDPVIVFESRTPEANAAGWNNSDVTVTWTCTDDVAVDSGASTLSTTVSTEGANQSATGTCVDVSGNTASDTQYGINIDKTAPSVSWVGGPAAGSSHYFGSVPAAPTCDAVDELSGPESCDVTGYGTSVGDHTMTATATDVAGNETTETRTYTVLAWTLGGFFRPVDMGADVWNSVKGGSTVPLKFEVFAGTTELTDIAVVDSFTVKGVACPQTGATSDDTDLTSTGGTTLRYDLAGGQFIQNWQTPKKAGACYRVTMTTDDGSSIEANFRLK